jgi:hypothetical protein
MFTPILTYGSEVWGVDSTFKDSDPFEKLHIKFTNVSEILGITQGFDIPVYIIY